MLIFRKVDVSISSLSPTILLPLALVSAILARLTHTGIPRLFSLLRENTIRFEDALGRIERLPYQQFRHWQVRLPFEV